MKFNKHLLCDNQHLLYKTETSPGQLSIVTVKLEKELSPRGKEEGKEGERREEKGEKEEEEGEGKGRRGVGKERRRREWREGGGKQAPLAPP